MSNINTNDSIMFPENNKKLFRAILQSDHEAMKKIFAEGFDIHAMDEGRSLLLLTAMSNNSDSFDLLINSTDNTRDFMGIANITDKNGDTPLIYATAAANMGIVEALTDMLGADVNHQNLNGKSALFFANTTQHIPVVKHLHKTGADLALKDKNRSTPLLVIVQYGHTPLVEFYISNMNARDLNAQNMEGDDALMIAIRSGHVHIAKFLISSGVSCFKTNKNDETALKLARSVNNLEIVDAIEAQQNTAIDTMIEAENENK